MKYDIAIHKGRLNRPAAIFIHGLGMDKRIWTNPDEARILGGRFPIRYILLKKPEPIYCSPGEKTRYRKFSIGKTVEFLKTSFADLRALKYTVITWSQRRPAGPIDIAAEELKEVAKLAKEYSRAGLILIGHSRGGLVARKYLENRDESVRGLITLATPHSGSTMAKWVDYILPMASIISSLIPESSRDRLSSVTRRILDFIESRAIKELLPDSEFFASLRDYRAKDLYCLSFGGTNPSLFSLYRWRAKRIKTRSRQRQVLEPELLFSFPDAVEKIIPEGLFPEELKSGYGDGLVSAKSSILPGCTEHYDFPVNHAAILFDREVREKIIEAVERI